MNMFLANKNAMAGSVTRRQAIVRGLGLAATPLLAQTPSPQFRKGEVIRTLLRDIPPASLTAGATLFHEHMSFTPDFLPKVLAIMRTQTGGPPAAGPAPAPSDGPYFLQDLNLMADELAAAAKEGVACVVDGGHPDMGRDIGFLKRLSARSGMPIVAGAGYYTQPFYPPEISAWSEGRIADELIRQCAAEPIGALGEIGISEEMTADERKVHGAIGKVHVATNLPVFTHTAFGRAALEQLDVLEAAGVAPERVAIGHMGGLLDAQVSVHKQICKRGAYIGFDRQGGRGDAAQVPLVLALIEAGYAERLLFASDFSNAAQLKRNGGPGYAKTVTVFVPKLREAGVKEELLHQILVDNPRRFLAFVPKQRRPK